MAGYPKHARIASDHLHTPVEAATAITRAGHARTMVWTGGLGLIAVALFQRKPAPGELKVPGRTWLTLLPGSFVLIGADPLRGRPRGEPFARISCREVAAVELTRKLSTLRARVTLHDGRAFDFELPRRFNGKKGVEVVELLRERCAAASVPAAEAAVA